MENIQNIGSEITTVKKKQGALKQIINLLLSFAPWIAFLILAGHSLLRLDIALVVASALVVVMAVTGLHRGAVLWASYIFFGTALLFVLALKNMWFITHLGILANGTLFATVFLGMMFGKPFTEDYARAEAPREIWETAGFVRACYTTTSVWALIFLFNLASSIVAFYNHEIPGWRFTAFNYIMLVSGVLYTSVYSQYKRRRREQARRVALNNFQQEF
ncbi:MAG: hypothetical protein WC071_13435 [Victivallaceae bacterium]